MEGRETTQNDLKTIQMPKRFILMRFLHNVAHHGRLAAIGHRNFSLFLNLILNNHTKLLFTIHYSIRVDLDRNQLRRHQNLFTTKFIH